MEYRDFRYTNELGNVQLERGSLLGICVSWLILKVLGISLVLVVAGISFCSWKYLTLDQVHASTLDPMTPEGVAASHIPPIDYGQYPPRSGLTALITPVVATHAMEPRFNSRSGNPRLSRPRAPVGASVHASIRRRA
jgi:hypothetical protein